MIFEKQTSHCEAQGLSWALQDKHILDYAVLLLEHGVLCVLPILWAVLLFSEAGSDFWAGGAAGFSPRNRAGNGTFKVDLAAGS